MANRITQNDLKTQAFTLSRMTGLLLYVQYENGYANLYERVDTSGAKIISYENTKRELYDQMITAINLITSMQYNKGKENTK